jgi:predicted DNA binding CopG/RHH family protein
MRKQYDLREMTAQKNPYARRLKKQITIRLGEDVLEHFKQMADETGMPYQRLIDLYLRDCVASDRKLAFHWD